MATKVKLRKKPISGNKESLYLDIYPPIINPETGEQTRRDFLGLYLYAESVKDKNGKAVKVKLSPLDKNHNKENLQLAEQIRQRRENELNKPEVYTAFEKEQLRIKALSEHDFVAYFRDLTNKRKASNHDNWVSSLNYLIEFTGGSLTFAEVNEKFCNQFKEYLLSVKSRKSEKVKLAQNSAVSYFNKLKATLKQAHKEGYFQTDLNSKVEPIKPAETQRNFLTLEELNRLVKTHCNNKLLKKAALFSAMTGLRFSDIKNLTWKELHYSKDSGYTIQFIQQKTKGVEVLPISEQAYKLLEEPGKDNEKVFEGLNYSAYENKHLYQWIGAAGITKNITFHCFRHTFATLQLSKGTDLYTVSKMLGHREIKTTQIYAKVIDRMKREAADKIKLDL